MSQGLHLSKHLYARIAPSKVRRVAGVIRQKPVNDAISLLAALPHRGARFLEAVLHTAVANAEESGSAVRDGLVVVAATVDGGPMYKRIRAKSRGMAYVERHRSSHITVVVAASLARN